MMPSSFNNLLYSFVKNSLCATQSTTTSLFVGSFFSVGFYFYGILFISTIRVSPRVVYHYVSSEIFERAIDIYNLSVASVGAVFFKGEAQKQDFAIFHWSALQTQAVDNLVSDISPP